MNRVTVSTSRQDFYPAFRVVRTAVAPGGSAFVGAAGAIALAQGGTRAPAVLRAAELDATGPGSPLPRRDVDEVAALAAVLQDPRRLTRSSADRKIDATPAYGASRGIRGP